MEQITRREQLLDFKRRHGLRDDWHEPDNQGITAEVRGTPGSFDNAMSPGSWFGSASEAHAELHVVLRRDVDEPTPDDDLAVVNLATLCAWATGHEPLTAAERVQDRIARLDPEGAWRRVGTPELSVPSPPPAHPLIEAVEQVDASRAEILYLRRRLAAAEALLADLLPLVEPLSRVLWGDLKRRIHRFGDGG